MAKFGGSLSDLLAQATSVLGQTGMDFTGARSAHLRGMTTEEYRKEKGFADYETPQSYLDMLGLTKTQARQEMPGYSQMKGDINEAAAAGLSGAQNLDSASAAAVLLGSQQNRMNYLRQLGLAASQYQDTARQRHTQAVGMGAQYEDQAYQYNQWLPTQMKLNEEMSRENQERQTRWQLLDTMMGAGIQGGGMYAQNQWYGNQMGNMYGQGAQVSPMMGQQQGGYPYSGGMPQMGNSYYGQPQMSNPYTPSSLTEYQRMMGGY